MEHELDWKVWWLLSPDRQMDWNFCCHCCRSCCSFTEFSVSGARLKEMGRRPSWILFCTIRSSATKHICYLVTWWRSGGREGLLKRAIASAAQHALRVPWLCHTACSSSTSSRKHCRSWRFSLADITLISIDWCVQDCIPLRIVRTVGPLHLRVERCVVEQFLNFLLSRGCRYKDAPACML